MKIGEERVGRGRESQGKDGRGPARRGGRPPEAGTETRRATMR